MKLQALVLNQDSVPHQLASWKQAICLVYTNKAIVIDVYEATVSSPSVTLAVPAVIKIVKDIGHTKNDIKFSRGNMLLRDKSRCCYCGEKKPPRDLTYDHVMPRSRWTGPMNRLTWWTNVVMACKPCNIFKGDRTPAEAGMRMHFKPHVPKSLPMTQPLLVDVADCPEQWKKHLFPTALSA